MRSDLARLLRDRPIVHPSRIVMTTLEGRELRVRTVGNAWWQVGADLNHDHEMKLVFGGVGEGCLELLDFESEDDEALLPFSVISKDNIPWVQSRGSAIYCNAPLPKPLEIYLKIDDFLAAHGAFRPAARYLNCPHDGLLSSFVQITQASHICLVNFLPQSATWSARNWPRKRSPMRSSRLAFGSPDSCWSRSGNLSFSVKPQKQWLRTS